MDAFDAQELLEDLDGDREFLAESAGMLDKDAPLLLQQIREALERDDAEAVCAGAHTLKSMVGNFCAQPAFNAALEMETLGREGRLTDCRVRFESLESQVALLQKALRDFLNKSD